MENLPTKRHTAVAPVNTIIGNPMRIIYLLFPPVVFIIVVAAAFKPSCDSQSEKIGAVASGYYIDQNGIEHEAEGVLDAYVQQTISEAEAAKEVFKDPFQESPPERKQRQSQNDAAPVGVGDVKTSTAEAYIARFAKTAQTEMHKYGIPASISLAQGLVESRAGNSTLARRNNNHFGMKCFSKKCAKGHCSNFTDDSHKDFFRIYGNAWESWRAHSQMLASGRYAKLRKHGSDYRKWAYGLKALGYATDKRYAEKLIGMIERYDLHRFDK